MMLLTSILVTIWFSYHLHIKILFYSILLKIYVEIDIKGAFDLRLELESKSESMEWESESAYSLTCLVCD